MKIKKDLKEYLEESLKDSALSHLEVYQNRYFGCTKSELRYDLEVYHDNSLEIEYAEDSLGRKLSETEEAYLINQFNKEVINAYKKDVFAYKRDVHN